VNQVPLVVIRTPLLNPIRVLVVNAQSILVVLLLPLKPEGVLVVDALSTLVVRPPILCPRGILVVRQLPVLIVLANHVRHNVPHAHESPCSKSTFRCCRTRATTQIHGSY